MDQKSLLIIITIISDLLLIIITIITSLQAFLLCCSTRNLRNAPEYTTYSLKQNNNKQVQNSFLTADNSRFYHCPNPHSHYHITSNSYLKQGCRNTLSAHPFSVEILLDEYQEKTTKKSHLICQVNNNSATY